MRIIIHIGFCKTGTTWLQRVVFPEWLEDEDFMFYRLFAFDELSQEPKGNILISNETIACGPGYSLNRLKNVLAMFPDAKVMITSRDIIHLRDSYNYQMILSKKKGSYTVHDIATYQDNVCAYLRENDTSFVISYLEDFDFPWLAKFLGVSPPTDEQVERWKNTKVLVRRPKWVYAVLKVLNRYKGNKLRWLLIYLTDPERKNKKWYYL